MQNHDFQNGPSTGPTNPEVAACREPVFWPRFVVSILKVYREHLQSILSGVRPLFLGQVHEGASQHATVRFGAPEFSDGLSHVTHKYKSFLWESGKMSGMS